MSLRFDADTELVNIGSATDIDNMSPVTLFAVFRPTALDATLHHIVHLNTNFYIREGAGTTGDIQFFRDYSTTDLLAQSSGSVMSANTWYAVACVDGGAAVAPLVFHGALPGDLAEVTYGTQQTPAGTALDDSGNDKFIGHNDGNTARSFVGDVARVMLLDVACTLQQCNALLHDPWSAFAHGANFLRWYELGYNQATDVPELTLTGAAGTITGATLSDPAPIAPVWSPRSTIFIPAAATAIRDPIMRGVIPAAR